MEYLGPEQDRNSTGKCCYQSVESILKNCVVCKIIQGKTLASPGTPALSSYRVNHNHVFENTGLDFRGHSYFKGDYSSSGDTQPTF